MRVLPLVGLTLSLAAASATSAQAADFNCSASAGRLTVLGKTVEPVSANLGAVKCASITKTLSGPAAGLPAPLSIGTLVSATQLDSAKNSVLASGGIADVRIGALPTLPIQLPQIAIPDAVRAALQTALQGTTIDLTAVKAAIPVLPTLPGTARTTSRDLLPGVPALPGAPALPPALDPVVAPVSDAVSNAVNTAVSALTPVTSAANATWNSLRASIPDKITLGSAASVDDLLNGLLPLLKLPNVDLLRIRGAMAYASGTCVNGKSSVAGESQVAGLSVLGQDLPVGEVVDKVLSLIDSGNIDLSKITLPTGALGLTDQQTALIGLVAPATTALNTAIATASNTLHTALAGLPAIAIPEALASVKVTPGSQVRSGDSITQQALKVVITVAGQKILDAVIGEAKASAAGVCGAATNVVNNTVNPNTTTGATLQCSKRDLVLVDVLERAGRVKLTGVANPKLAGKTVSIVFDATNKVVAHAVVAKDGSFDTTAAMPPSRLADSNSARYTAVLGHEKSINLKLRRRMIIDSMTSRNGYVTITGRVVQPLAKPGRAITLMRRVSCTKDQVVTRFHPASNGRFSVRVKAPKGVGTAVYRMTTQVLNSSSGTHLFETFTLPRAVDLHR